jgi:uncharacterized protein YyaL (SSP411 family)
MSDYLRQFPGASDIKRQLAMAADKLAALYEKNNGPDWQWFEDVLAYDNAVLPHALFVAGFACGEQKYFEVAEKTCEFLLSNTYDGSHFGFVGCNGWYKRGGSRAMFDQQPIEAASMVMMLRAAYEATRNDKFLALQRKAFGWFLGENDLHIPVYDFRTKGCYDGLVQGGVNLNQGAESTLSFLLSLLAIVESYAVVDKLAESAEVTEEKVVPAEAEIADQTSRKTTPIRSITGKNKRQRDEVEELA